MTDSLVTVIILAARREHLLSNTLNTVRAQSYPHIQIMVTGSNEPAIRRITDHLPEIELLTEDAASDTQLLNRALERAKGTYLAVLESGNLWYPDFLAVQLEMLVTGKADLTIANGLEETIGPDPVVLFQARQNYRKVMAQTFDSWYHPTQEELLPMLTGDQLPPVSAFVFRKALLDKGWTDQFIRYYHQAAMISLLNKYKPVIATCRKRLWFRRLDPLTHLQPIENAIREGEQCVLEATSLLTYTALRKDQRSYLKDSISLQYRLLALSCRKAALQTDSIRYTLKAIRYRPVLLKILVKKSKTYLLRRI
jgi:glycosyltransferase involved in cell wall biosynthesis